MWKIHNKIRTGFFARFFDKIGLYLIYRVILFKLGYQNPFSAVLKITSKCNLKCTHCPWNKNLNNDKDTDFWKQTIDKVFNMGVRTIVFEGGEPTHREDLPELINYAKKKKLKTIVISNATNSLKGIEPDNFWFSVEGHQELHDKIRGKNTFEKMISQFRYCIDKKYNNLAVITLSKKNYKEIERTINEINPFFKSILINFIYPYKNSQDEAIPTEDLKSLSNKIIELKRKYPSIINSTKGLKIVGAANGIKCYPWWNIHVSSDGVFVHDCVVKQIEEYDCLKCYLSCYNEVYQGANFNIEALFEFFRFRGIKIFSFLKK